MLHSIEAQRLAAKTMLHNQKYGDMNERKKRVLYNSHSENKHAIKKDKIL